METIKCKRCAQCCHLIKMVDGKPMQTNIRCKYLMMIGKLAFCRVYKNRIGKKLPFGAECTERKNSFFDYKGCPYNDGKKIIMKVDKSGVKVVGVGNRPSESEGGC